MRRKRATAVVSMLLLLSASGGAGEVLGAARGAECDVKGAVVGQGRGWSTVTFPEFPAWPDPNLPDQREVRPLLSIHPLDPRTMYVSDGIVMMRTTDGGCHWEASLSLPLLPSLEMMQSSAQYEISSIALPRSRKDSSVYVSLESSLDPTISQPLVGISRDAGETWKFVDPEAPLGCALPKVRVAPSASESVYLACATTSPASPPSRAYFTSVDSGETWVAHELDTETTFFFQPFDFVVDPVDPQTLWEWDALLLRRSEDSGQTWTLPFDPLDDDLSEGLPALISQTAIKRARGGPAQLLLAAGSSGVRWSHDGGKKWALLPAGYSIAGIQFGRSNKEVFIMTSSSSPAVLRTKLFGTGLSDLSPRHELASEAYELEVIESKGFYVFLKGERSVEVKHLPH